MTTHIYNVRGPPLAIEASVFHDLQRLALERSQPDVPVTVGTLVTQALAAYLRNHAEQLQTLYAADEQAELERVMATHGGGEAA